jgi:glycosyltransferase involved in cell wall biosynthesis
MEDGRPWPKISIVTPSFNQGRFIEETLRSVLLQGYPDLEYFIMDGGSTDETAAIIRKHERWLAGWVSEKDRGQSSAVNKGMAQAGGEILAYINSDDIYLPSALATAARTLAGKTGWCTSDVQVMDENSRQVHYYVSHVPRDWIHQMSRIEITTPQPCTFWTRDLWRQCGPFDEEMFFSLDWDLFCKFLRQGHRPVRCPAPLAALRWHESSKTHRHKDERMRRDDDIIWQRGLAASGWTDRMRARLVRRWAGSPLRLSWKNIVDTLRRHAGPRS